jgi:hypothetical protein
LKAVREKKQITYERKSTKITADFSMETLKARRTWSEVFRALNENNFNPRTLYPAKLSVKIDRAIKIFHNKRKLKQCMTTRPPLQNILQGILHTSQWLQKTGRKAILISDKVDFKLTLIKGDKEGHSILIKGEIDQKELTIINIYAPKVDAPSFIKRTLNDLNTYIDFNTV